MSGPPGRRARAATGEPLRRLDARRLQSTRIVLDRLGPQHAAELASVLQDASLHRFIGGTPATTPKLRAQLRRQAAGRSPDGRELWLNWIVRTQTSSSPVGTAQATVSGLDAQPIAQLAWVIGSAHQHQGFAKEAAGLIASWLRAGGVRKLCARIHPDHHASIAVARSIGLVATDQTVDGERCWASEPPSE